MSDSVTTVLDKCVMLLIVFALVYDPWLISFSAGSGIIGAGPHVTMPNTTMLSQTSRSLHFSSSYHYINTIYAQEQSAVQQQNQSTQKVKYTLNLRNNSLMKGNIGPSATSSGSDYFNLFFYGSFADPANGLIYVTCPYLSKIFVLNPSSEKFVATIPVGNFPTSMAFDRSNGVIYVANIEDGNLSMINAVTNTLIGSISLGFMPQSVAYDDSNSGLLVSDVLNGTLKEYNTTTMQVMASVNVTYPTSARLANIYYCAVNNLVYGVSEYSVFAINIGTGSVATLASNIWYSSGLYYDNSRGLLFDIYNNGANIGIINTTKNSWAGNITNPTYPIYPDYQGLAVVPNSTNVFVADASTDSVAVISTITETQTGNIPAGVTPSSIIYNQRDGFVYVTNAQSGSITIINPTTQTVEDTAGAISSPSGVAYSQSNSQIYIADAASNRVLIVNGETNQVTGSVPVGFAPLGVTFDPLNGNIYVANSASNNVTVISSSDKVTGSIRVGFTPASIVVDPENGMVYVTNSNSNNVTIISGSNSSSLGSISVGNYPDGIAYNPVNHLIYVANSGSHNVSVINTTTNKVVLSPQISYEPTGAAFDPFNGFIDIVNTPNPWYGLTVITSSNYIVGAMTFVDSSSVLGVGGGSIVYDPADTNLYATIPETNQVQVVSSFRNTNLPAGKITVGQYPSGIAYDPLNNYVYVANSYSGTVSVITTGTFYNVTFIETGLPASMQWTVRTEGGFFSTKANTLALLLPNGTFNYTVVSSSPRWGTPSPTGKLTVDGGSVNLSFQFSIVFLVTFQETGMPEGYGWEVIVHGQSHPSYSYEIGFSEPDGTYGYSLYEIVNSTDRYIQSGSFSVTGHNITVNVNLSPSHLLLDEVLVYLIPAVLIVATAVAALVSFKHFRQKKRQ